jgi:hypothetical protein
MLVHLATPSTDDDEIHKIKISNTIKLIITFIDGLEKEKQGMIYASK